MGVHEGRHRAQPPAALDHLHLLRGERTRCAHLHDHAAAHQQIVAGIQAGARIEQVDVAQQ